MNRIAVLLPIAVIVGTPLTSCAAPPDADPDHRLSLQVGNARLWLEDRSGLCGVRSAGTAASATLQVLGIPWPCHFHVDSAGTVRTVRSKGQVYVLVESSKPAAEPASNDCETFLQAIRVQGNAVEISPHHDRVASCPPFQWDTFLFRALFE